MTERANPRRAVFGTAPLQALAEASETTGDGCQRGRRVELAGCGRGVASDAAELEAGERGDGRDANVKGKQATGPPPSAVPLGGGAASAPAVSVRP